MFAIVVSPQDPPLGYRLIAQYSLHRNACTVSVVELASASSFVLRDEGEADSAVAGTLRQGLELARQVVESIICSQERSGS
jgi:hypothetical protein